LGQKQGGTVKIARGFILAGVLLAAIGPAAPASSAQETATETRSASGTVTDFAPAKRRLEIKTANGPMAFTWNSETRFNGTVSPGARVVIRYTISDGQNVARTIGVSR
jgi:hypothetical protein